VHRCAQRDPAAITLDTASATDLATTSTAPHGAEGAARRDHRRIAAAWNVGVKRLPMSDDPVAAQWRSPTA
jgi:hypothetical protein